MSDKTVAEVDKSVLGQTNIKEPGIKFFDVRRAPFEVYGLVNPADEPVFKRLPDNVGQNVNNEVKKLYLFPAGGRVRFSTNSRYIAIKASIPRFSKFDHMALTGIAGFDLYIDGEAGSRYHRPFRPGTDIVDGYEAILRFPDNNMRYFTINFPLYASVDRLYVGLEPSAALGAGMKYRSPLPIVYYGSSITQGACASHPGNAYQSIISRRMNLDFINLGFSGSGRGEEIIAKYMASLDMLAFVSDYDHNAPNTKHLSDTHFRLYEIIREANPDIPYIMLSRPDYDLNVAESIANRDVIIDSYRRARAGGDKKVYYIDGEGIFRGPDEDLCTVDGTHPTDIGFLKMADAIERVLVRALR